jgi:hypothetical protein
VDRPWNSLEFISLIFLLGVAYVTARVFGLVFHSLQIQKHLARYPRPLCQQLADSSFDTYCCTEVRVKRQAPTKRIL